jgi:hypothetical protein
MGVVAVSGWLVYRQPPEFGLGMGVVAVSGWLVYRQPPEFGLGMGWSR